MQGVIPSANKLWISVLIACAFLFVYANGANAQDEASRAELLAPTAAGPATAAPGGGIEIRAVQVNGLEHLSESVVIAGLTIKVGDILVGNFTAKKNEAEQALYNTGWFRSQPEIALDSVEGGVAITVTVQENPLYKGTQLKGNTLFSTERLVRELEGTPGPDGKVSGARLVRGEVINVKKLVAGLDAILNLYQGNGYIAAGIQDYSFSLAPADEGVVSVTIGEGMLEEVIISGLNRTKENVVRGQITHMRQGRVIMRADVERDLNQVYNTGLFDSATPSLEPSLKEGYAKLVITVEEAPTGQVGLGLGYSTLNGLQGSVSYNERNLFGTGKQLNAMVTFSANRPGFDVSYADPYLTERSFWSVGLFSLDTRQQRNVGTPYESELAVQTKGVDLGYGQRLSDYDSWQASFSVADYDYTIRKGDPFYGYSPAQRARLAAAGQTRKVGLTYSHDTRDNQFSTKEGYLGKATGELAGFGGDFDFNKWTFEGREFFRLGPGSLGFRQRLGIANGTVPLYEEYRLGGVNSIRGVSEDLLTGTHSFLSNVEYRLPINETFGVVGFVDSGWAGETLSSADYAAGAGLGLRVRVRALGLGAVRLDYGWELAGEPGSNNRFHFFLGEMF